MAPIFKKETRNNLTHTYPNKSLDWNQLTRFPHTFELRC
jgi:hypothetical protein